MICLSRWIVAGFAALAVSAGGTLHAQQSPNASVFAPLPTPTVNPDMLKTPAVKPDADTTKADLNTPKALEKKKPLHADVGGYDLHFKAGSRGLDSTGRQGWDSGEMSNAASIEGNDRERRGFLGFKLSKPTN